MGTRYLQLAFYSFEKVYLMTLVATTFSRYNECFSQSVTLKFILTVQKLGV